jgi:hypothetical protein
MIIHSNLRKIISDSFLNRKIRPLLRQTAQRFSVFSARSIRRLSKNTAVQSSSRTIAICGDPNHHVTAGYYDVSPFSLDGTRLLAIMLPLPLRTPSASSWANIGYYDLSSKIPEFHELDRTNAWCWQQGCRLQWALWSGQSHVIYNIADSNSYKSRIRDIETKAIVREFELPVYSVSADGSKAVTLNFSRLQRLRPGYGYSTFPDDTVNKLASEDDGIWLMDLRSGQKKLIISLQQLAGRQPVPEMDKAEHYVNHLCVNQSGTRYMFFHLWVRKDKRWSRLYTADFEGKDIRLLESRLKVSHYTWKDDETILATGTADNRTVEYAEYNDQTGVRSQIGADVLVKDGHPSYLGKTGKIISDAYPDRFREQSVFIFDCATGKTETLWQAYMPFRFTGEVRCDLHPRLGPGNRCVCVDCVRNNRRVIEVIDISDSTREKTK